MAQHIRILQSYKQQTDGQLIAAAGAVIKGMTGNTAFPSPPVDLKTAQAAVDELNAAMAAQPNGGPAATSNKIDKRTELIAILAKLAHYVQDNCQGNATLVLNAGFTVATSSRASSPLDQPSIASVDFGNTGQLVVKVNPITRAKCYEVRTAAIGPGGVPGPVASRRIIHQLARDDGHWPHAFNNVRVSGSCHRRLQRRYGLEQSGLAHLRVTPKAGVLLLCAPAYIKRRTPCKPITKS